MDLVVRLRMLWQNPQVRYPVSMMLYLVIFGGVFSALIPELGGFIAIAEEFTAQTVHRSIGMFSDATTHRGNLVSFDGVSKLIILECVGLLEMIIYSACVLAFPAPAWSKTVGLPLGCVAIFIFNVIRIAMLLVIGSYWAEYYDFFHVYLWQGTLIAMIVAVLYGWIMLVVPR